MICTFIDFIIVMGFLGSREMGMGLGGMSTLYCFCLFCSVFLCVFFFFSLYTASVHHVRGQRVEVEWVG